MMVEVSVELFGAFRDLVPLGFLKVSLSPSSGRKGVSVIDLKNELQQCFAATSADFDAVGLLAHSVLATEERVLGQKEEIPNGARLVLLPPVCGG